MLRSEKSDAFQIGVFVWPLVVCERHRGGTTLQRRLMGQPGVLNDHAHSATKMGQE